MIRYSLMRNMWCFQSAPLSSVFLTITCLDLLPLLHQVQDVICHPAIFSFTSAVETTACFENNPLCVCFAIYCSSKSHVDGNVIDSVLCVVSWALLRPSSIVFWDVVYTMCLWWLDCLLCTTGTTFPRSCFPTMRPPPSLPTLAFRSCTVFALFSGHIQVVREFRCRDMLLVFKGLQSTLPWHISLGLILQLFLLSFVVILRVHFHHFLLFLFSFDNHLQMFYFD